MAIETNFNTNPYFDDYDEEKDFLRVLFRPSFAVQARELTQLQTMLQKQVERFGLHIFEEGSPVLGGQLTLDLNASYLKLEDQFLAVDIDVDNFDGKLITGQTSGATGQIVKVVATDGTDPNTVYFKTVNGLDFQSGEDIETDDSTPFSATIQSGAGSTGEGSLVSIDNGVFFTNGFFARVDAQTIVLKKYETDPSVRVGLSIVESIVDEDDDTSLLDPANGSFNFAAPGAYRFRIRLTLQSVALVDDETDDLDQFIELTRIENGVVQKYTANPLYSAIGDEMARRTFDESGNYTIRPFKIDLKNSSANTEQLDVVLDEGKAYVRGYSYTSIGTDTITVDKARDTRAVENQQISVRFGNYVLVSNVDGLFGITTQETIDLHSVISSDTDLTSNTTLESTRIGSAKPVLYRRDSAGVYRLYLRDFQFRTISDTVASATANTITFTDTDLSSEVDDAYNGMLVEVEGRKYIIDDYTASNNTLSIVNTFTSVPSGSSTFSITPRKEHIESFVTKSNGAPPTITKSADVDLSSHVNGVSEENTSFTDTSLNSLVFNIPDSFVETLRDTSANLEYKYRRKVSATFSNGAATVTSTTDEIYPGTGSSLSGDDINQFIVSVADSSGSSRTNGEIVTIASANLSVDSTVLTLDTGNTAESFTADVIALFQAENATERAKTLVFGSIPNETDHADTSNAHLITTSELDRLNAGQKIIETPNRVAGETDSLDVSDVFRVVKVLDVGKDSSLGFDYSNTATWNVVTYDVYSNTDLDITSNYKVNTGQKDYIYDHGSISLIAGRTAPVGPVVVYFDYFEPGTIGPDQGFFSVDSYGSINYEDIPDFKSPSSGQITRLSDVIDFRPVRDKNTTTFDGGIRIPDPNFALTVDYNYFLSRIDKIVLTPDRQFKVLRGVSSEFPAPPLDVENSMTLYVLTLPPYTESPSSVDIEYIDNRRYTMSDIGDIEKRIRALEAHAILSKLESETLDTVIFDDFGVEKFINGALVDNFSGHGVGDVENLDYNIAIDFSKKQLQVPFTSNSVDLKVSTANSSSIAVASDGVITLAYSNTTFVSQGLASKSINVNPFNVTNFNGGINLDPARDVWFEQEERATVTVNLSGDNDGWEQIGRAIEDIRPNGFGTEWNDWQSRWTGVPQTATRVVDVDSTTRRDGRRLTTTRQTTRETVTTRNRVSFRTGTQRTFGVDTIRADLGRRLVDVSVIPLMRSIDISFTGFNLKPNTDHYAFFDDTDVNANITPTGGALGGQLTSNASGGLSGTFSLPSGQFRTGERIFRVIDDSTNNLATASSKAEGSFVAQGTRSIVENVEGLIRQPVVRTRTVSESRVETDAVVDRTRTTSQTQSVRWIDPLAQSFLVNAQIYPNGLFLTDVDLFFQAKDDNLPVFVQIRPMVNGYPSSSTIIPGGEVTKLASEVNISNAPSTSNTATATTFEFDHPLYLPPGEYAIVVLSNSNKYLAYVGELGEEVIGGNQRIVENPYAGVLFKSQNASTWSAVQEEDLMFVLRRADFVTSGLVEFGVANSTLGGLTVDSTFDYNVFQVTTDEVLTTPTDANFVYSYELGATNTRTSNESLVMNDNVFLRSRGQIRNGDNAYFRLIGTLETSNTHVSPILDEQAVSLIAITNQVNNLGMSSNNLVIVDSGSGYANTDTLTISDGNGSGANVFVTTNNSGAIVGFDVQATGSGYVETPTISINTSGGSNANVVAIGETSREGGNAIARYITRRVTLADGFNSNDLQVRFNGYRSQESEFEVYFKVISEDDEENFDQKNYVRMELKPENDIDSVGLNDFREYVFVPEVSPITYTNNQGIEFADFNTFAIKIVLRSTNQCYYKTPRIRDLKVMALAP